MPIVDFAIGIGLAVAAHPGQAVFGVGVRPPVGPLTQVVMRVAAGRQAGLADNAERSHGTGGPGILQQPLVSRRQVGITIVYEPARRLQRRPVELEDPGEP